ncbi:hypothetical protein U1Q18_033705 [Sarracenia purpurea var. burkii]
MQAGKLIRLVQNPVDERATKWVGEKTGRTRWNLSEQRNEGRAVSAATSGVRVVVEEISVKPHRRETKDELFPPLPAASAWWLKRSP